MFIIHSRSALIPLRTQDFNSRHPARVTLRKETPMSGTPLIKRAYNLGLKAVPNFETLPDDVIAYYEQHLDQIPRALARGFVPAEEVKQASFFSIIASTALGAVAGKPTKKCFAGSYYAYRDTDFDRWLPADQLQATPCEITTLASAKDATFAQWVSTILGVSASTPTKTLGSLLIERSHAMTLVQADNVVGRTENGEATGMQTNGYANFFFVETGNEDDPVSVARVRRYDSRWNAYVDGLGDVIRWSAGGRILVRNLDASKLGL